MSDERGIFDTKTDRMFAVFLDQIDDITKLFQVKICSEVIRTTYGPGNQWHGTPYEATGRLRAGWQWGTEPPPETAGFRQAGPFDADGLITIGRISLKILQSEKHPAVWLWNNVGYAWLVHEGKGGHSHIGPRPWVEIAADRGHRFLQEARRDVMAKAG